MMDGNVKDRIIHISMSNIYKYKSLIIDWHEWCGPTFLRRKDHEPMDMRNIKLRQWGEFNQWFNLSDEDKETYRI